MDVTLAHIAEWRYHSLPLEDLGTPNPFPDNNADGEKAGNGGVSLSGGIIIVSYSPMTFFTPIREITQICKCTFPINSSHIIMRRKEVVKRCQVVLPEAPHSAGYS